MPPVHELRRASRRHARLQARRGRRRRAEGDAAGSRPKSSSPRAATARPTSGASSAGRATSTRARSIRSSSRSTPARRARSCPSRSAARNRFASLTDLGFIVVQIDGMGTANRSKAFHDVCWHNLKDAGFPDRILWIKAAAAKYPVHGSRAASASTAARPAARTRRRPCCSIPSSTRPPSPAAAATTTAWTRPRGTSSGWAIRSARSTPSARTSTTPHRLQGKLMLIVGELDNNVPIESTLSLRRRADQGRQGFRLRGRPRRRPRHGRRVRRPPHARFLRAAPARQSTERSDRRGWRRSCNDKPRRPRAVASCEGVRRISRGLVAEPPEVRNRGHILLRTTIAATVPGQASAASSALQG